MNEYQLKRVWEEIMRAQHPVLISDERIDGDSLGSALAIAEHLHSCGKTIPVYVAAPLDQSYRWLPSASACTHDISVFFDPRIDLVVAFDCSDGEFIRERIQHISSSPMLINIDHHATNDRYGTINLVDESAPATAELVYQLFTCNGVLPGRSVAQCLLTGICFDTTVFSNGATNERTFAAAGELTLCGASISDVVTRLFANKSVGALRMWGMALERLHKNPRFENHLVTCITRADLAVCEVNDEDADGLSNFLSMVSDVDTLRVLRETVDGGVKVSMRSTSVNVADIALSHGGGGHKKAAGYTVPNSRLVEQDGMWVIE